jgi:hypothetical protein
MTFERTLAWLDADETDARIELVQVSAPGQQPTLEIRFQRECGALGWRTHRRMRLAAGQLGDLKMAMQLMDPDAWTAPRAVDGVVRLGAVRESA